MRKIFLFLLGLSIIPIFNLVGATSDFSTLGRPDIELSSNSGPPGTNLTITITHIPDISKESYPYPVLYIYLPFSQPFGSSLQSQCGGQDCFPVYTHDDALNGNFGDRTITFSLPSINNHPPIVLNGFENTSCDILLNTKVVERFSTLCNTKSEPPGIYQIRLAWVLESDHSKSYTLQTIPFTVIAMNSSASSPSVADNGDTILKQYQNGTISFQQFYTELKTRNWTDEQIRQALGVLGKLPHQMGFSGPDNRLPIFQTNSSINMSNLSTENLTIQKNNSSPLIQSNVSKIIHVLQNNQSNSTPSHPTLIAPNTTQISPPVQNNFISNYIIVGLSIAAALIMLAVIILARLMKK